MVQYYSTITKELYKTEEELIDAEEKVRVKRNEKDKDIESLNSAYHDFADAYSTLIALEEEFIKKYGRVAYMRWVNS